MKNWKRVLPLLIVLLLAVSVLSVSAFAAGDDSEMRTMEEVYVNPFYADVLTEDDLLRSEDVQGGAATYAVTRTYDTTEEVGIYLREQMKARATTVEVMLSSADDPNAIVGEIEDIALAHTGEPTEGDYLARQYGGYFVGRQWYTDSNGDPYDITLTYTITYYNTAEQEAAMDTAVSNVLNTLNLYNATDYEKVCGIYDYICDNVTYDYTNLNDDTYMLKYTAYAALVNKTAVCQGYANLFYRLALELGVDNRMISGISTQSGEGHAWNIVALDGLYYNVDSTWDAGQSSYDYFLRCPVNFLYHQRDAEYETTAWHTEYPMGSLDYMEPTLTTPVLSLTTDAGTGKPVLNWSAVTGADRYEVWRAFNSSKGSYEKLGTVTTTGYTDTSARPDEACYYKVRAIAGGASADAITAISTHSSPLGITCDCAQPQVTLTLNKTTGKPVLSWDAVDGAERYYIYRSNSRNGSYSYLTWTSKTSFTNSNTEAGVSYYYKVRAVSVENGQLVKASYSAYSPALGVTCDCARPVVTADVNATTGKPVIRWKAVDGADRYYIYRSTSERSGYQYLTWTSGTSLTNNNTTPGVTYYYQVCAYALNDSGVRIDNSCSAYSTPVEVTCADTLGTPVVTAANSKTTGLPVLSWDAVDGADRYYIYRSVDGGAYTYLDDTASASLTDQDAAFGVTYAYKVRAVMLNNAGTPVKASYSAYGTIEDVACVCARPVVTVALNSAGNPKISWDAVEGADRYKIYRSTEQGSGYSYWTSTTAESIVHGKNVVSGTTYWYQVQAVNDSDSSLNSAYSTPKSITVE